MIPSLQGVEDCYARTLAGENNLVSGHAIVRHAGPRFLSAARAFPGSRGTDTHAVALFVAAAMARESAKECGERIANGTTGFSE